jgi:hypothetical protein
VTALIAALSAAASDAQDPPSIKDVVRRVEQYVGSYGEKASIVVCTERYTQATARSADDRHEARTLISDFAIVKADTIHGWLGFRDVLDVDGRAVANRNDRLAHVLMASEGRYDEAERLSNESARYNVGTITRNFNVPTTALFFFVPHHHDRFKFDRRSIEPGGAWTLAFKEKRTPSLIQTPEGRSVLSTGILEVTPENGIVQRTVLIVDSKEERGSGRIDVRYARIDALDMWLPISMDESFECRRARARRVVARHRTCGVQQLQDIHHLREDQVGARGLGAASLTITGTEKKTVDLRPR